MKWLLPNALSRNIYLLFLMLMVFAKKETHICGCFELWPKRITDNRGVFVKTFHKYAFEAHGLLSDFEEDYYSVSNRGVLRGLHFQLPPFDHVKVVYCLAGEVLDVVVDLRAGSPSHGRFELLRLYADAGNMVYIPKGVAHGFYTLSTSATMMYKVSTVYSAEHDSGILWNSVGIGWPDDHPILSPRDAGFPPFASFRSPFVFERRDNIAG